jgi:hypothetical protein
LIKNIQDLELDLYRKNEELLDKEKSIKSLLRENDLLGEKLSAVEGDMKVILNNRTKIDNLEDIILRFINDEKDGIKDMKVRNNTNMNIVDDDVTRYTDNRLLMSGKYSQNTAVPGKI